MTKSLFPFLRRPGWRVHGRLYPAVWLARKTQWMWLWNWLDRQWSKTLPIVKRCDEKCWQTGDCTGACHDR